MVADPKAYLTLFPVAEQQAEQILPVFQAELAKKATSRWNDPPLDPSWTKPDAALVEPDRGGRGMLAERFAFCQTMPLDEFLATAEALRKSGYRPVRFRPYADGTVTRVAAVWTRDGRNWRLASGLTPDEVRQQDEKNRTEKFLPVDVAGYVATGDGKPADRYAALWVEKAGDDDARLYVGATDDDLTDVQKPLDDAKLIPRTLHALRSPDGRAAVLRRLGQAPVARRHHPGLPRPVRVGLRREPGPVQRPGARRRRGRRGRQAAVGRRAGPGGAASGRRRRSRPSPTTSSARSARARARLRLGENDKALDDLNAVLAKSKDDLDALELRAIAQARLGKKEPALADLAQYQKDAPERSRLYLAAVVAAELGDGADAAIEALEAALRKEPGDADLRYDAARAFALASKAVDRTDHAEGARPGRAGPRLARGGGPRQRPELRPAGRRPRSRPDPGRPGVRQDPRRRAPRTALCRRLVDRGAVRGGDPRRPRSRRAPAARPGAGRPGLSPRRLVGRPDVARGPAAIGLGLAPARWSRRRPRTGWPSVRRGRRWPWCAWARPRRSGPCCGTAPTPGSAASSSTGSTRWGRPARGRRRTRPDRILRLPGLPPPPGPARRWTPSSSTPRPRSGGP